MAKAPSPIRLQQSLMEAAASAGARQHRSTSEQVEYWAELGRRVAGFIDLESLTGVAAGTARLRVEPVTGTPVSPEAVFEGLERQREQGALPETVTSAGIRYQASRTRPGYLEQIDTAGNVVIGQFEGGEFVPLSKGRA